MSLITAFNEWMTLADAHELLGTLTPANDVEVQSMIDSIGAMILAYLQRDLRHAEYSQIVFRPEGSFISLNTWPVISISSIDVDGTAVPTPDDEFDIDYGLGLMHYSDEGVSFNSTQPKRITVQYISGYEILPLELQVIFKTLLSERYAGSTGTTGEIKKVNLVGVAAVEFATSGVSYTGVDKLVGVPEELKPYVGLLDKYRSDRLIGII